MRGTEQHCSGVGCPCIVVVPGRLPKGGASRENVIAESIRVLTELCEISSAHGVSLAFEFLGQTDCSVPTLDLAAEIVREVNQKNLGVVIDSFHFYAGNSTFEMIEALDPELIQIFHINDAEDRPRAELEDRHRLLPGLGILPLQQMISSFRKIGYDKVASVEISDLSTGSEIHSRLRAMRVLRPNECSRRQNEQDQNRNRRRRLHRRSSCRRSRTRRTRSTHSRVRRSSGSRRKTSRHTQRDGCRHVSRVVRKIGRSLITTPNTQHVSLSIAAIETGKHVFCEKPLATSVDDAQRVFKKTSETSHVFQVGHNRRFAPVYATLKRMLSETHKPHSAHVKMNRGELLNPVWTGDPAITGGFLYETPIHMFDMMRFLFGEVESLHAIGSTHEYKEVDDFSVLLKFVNGMHATLATAADASWLFPFERVEVFCHHATIVTREMESLTCSSNLEGHFTEQAMQQLPREEKWGYVQEDRAFIDAIVNSSTPLVTAFDGLMSRWCLQ